jgi:hypothetical protein
MLELSAQRTCVIVQSHWQCGFSCQCEGSMTPLTCTVDATRSICPSGSYCAGGVRTSCAAGRYGTAAGTATPDVACAGTCTAGYFCPEGSSGTAEPCGDATVFCPEGTPSRMSVLPGFYTSGSGLLLATQQSICPLGRYCIAGVMVLCPAGAFGRRCWCAAVSPSFPPLSASQSHAHTQSCLQAPTAVPLDWSRRPARGCALLGASTTQRSR